MYSQESNSTKRAQIAVITVSILLVVFFSVFALAVYLSDKEEVLPKEEILQSIESSADEGYSYVAQYLSSFGIGNFDSIKFRKVEAYFQSWYVGDLPITYEHAKLTANYYLEYFYDRINVNDGDENTDALINCYVAATGDRYAVYRNEADTEDYAEDSSGEFVGIGVSVSLDLTEDGCIKILSCVENSPAEAAGIISGDLIYSVNGQTVSELGVEGAADKIRGPAGTSVNIVILRGGSQISLDVTRALVTEKSVTYSLIADYGYIKISAFKGNTAEQFVAAIDYMEAMNVKGIIFDVRNNPGGQLTAIVKMLSYLVPNGTEIVSYVTNDGARQVEYAKDDKDGVDHVINVPCAVLCNGDSASAAELFTAALRDYRSYQGKKLIDSVIIGSTTYKKGVMQSQISLGTDGSSLTLTIAFYNPPSNVNYDGVGVIPDYQPNVDYEELVQYAVSLLDGLLSSDLAA